MNPLSEILPPEPVAALWAAAGAGWGAVAGGLWRGLSGRARRAALYAHVLTAAGLVLRSATLGYGFLDALIAATAGWWALSLATGFRPQRIVDPSGPALARLAAWLALAASGAVALHWAILGI